MKKKLIFIAEALWVGGIESALCNLLNRLDYGKFEVTCLILRDSRELVERLPPQCRLVVADRGHTVSFSDAYRYKRLYNLMEEPQNASRLRRLIWHGLNIFLRAPEAYLYAEYIKTQLNGEHFDTAVIYSDRTAETVVRSVSADRYLMFYHHGAMRREYHDFFGYRKAEKIIAVSKSQAEKLRAYRSKYAEKIIAINNIIDVDGVREKSLEPLDVIFPNECFNIVSCGRLSPAKGMDIAIEACNMLVRRGIKDIHWWIVGGGPEENNLRRQIEELGLSSSVTLLGMKDNPYPYLRRADLYVQPSRFEGHCVTVLESRLLAVPILATSTAAHEQLNDDKDGMLCEPNAESIANGIEKLYLNREILQKFIRAQQLHDFETDNAEIIRLLYDLF